MVWTIRMFGIRAPTVFKWLVFRYSLYYNHLKARLFGFWLSDGFEQSGCHFGSHLYFSIIIPNHLAHFTVWIRDMSGFWIPTVFECLSNLILVCATTTGPRVLEMKRDLEMTDLEWINLEWMKRETTRTSRRWPWWGSSHPTSVGDSGNNFWNRKNPFLLN